MIVAVAMILEVLNASSADEVFFVPNISEQQVADSGHGDLVDVEDVLVQGRRGAARVGPALELDGAEIDALGAWDIAEVLTRLTEALELSEQPMVIINGKIVASAGVFSSFPPDAIMRIEVLPPAATALYGGVSGQTVINIVLQRRYASYDGRIVLSRPTQGGASSLSSDLRRSSIVGDRAYILSLRTSHDDPLRAGERDRMTLGGGSEDHEVTLRPSTDLISANASVTLPFRELSGVFNLNAQTRESRSVANYAGEIVESHRRNKSLGGSAGISGSAYGWSLQGNLNGQVSRAQEDGFQEGHSENQSLGLNLSGSRSLIDLPMGGVVTNLSGNLMTSRSTVDRAQSRATSVFYTREGRGTLAIPLSKANDEAMFGRLVGDLQIVMGGGVRLNTGGGGEEVSGGLDWAPRKGLRLSSAWTASTDSVSDLLRSEPSYHGAPRVAFDFRAGEAVEIVPILGGNPDLKPPRSERFSLNAALGPFTSWGMAGNFGYQKTEATNGIGVLPDLTSDVEAAFPERFERDGNGRLISVDLRPLNLSSSLMEGLTTAVNFSLPRPQGAASNEAMVARFSLNYNLQLRNTVALLEGRPELDRLKGDGGGVSRQSLRAALDAKRGRWGLNASARWQDGYRTRRNGGRDDQADLVLKSFAAVDLKLTFQMSSSSIRASASSEEGGPRRRSSSLQVNLEVENLFDARPEARLGDGSAAPGYGRDAQDLIGRVVRLTLQRRF